ncbi:MAG: AAA family ATPase [Gammaproteobacteria bacterium]|nr:AAA family ATPase [Gammaproteobacteria bacterium]
MTLPPWLESARATVDAMGSRLPHGLLIQGPGGCGEQLLAEHLVRQILSLVDDRPAREIAHPDLRWVATEDAAFIVVDQVRGISDFLVQRPQRGPRKLVVIDEAERMNPNAANALLKSLEEPPADSFVVLVTSASERLLPTVRSRCQSILVQAPSAQQAMQWLVQQGIDPTLARYFTLEYGSAPFHVLDAVEREQEPLWPALMQARSSADLAGLSERLRNDNLASLLARWLRIVHGLIRRTDGQSPPNREKMLAFADTAFDVYRAAQVNSGLNRQVQVERLLLHWLELDLPR